MSDQPKPRKQDAATPTTGEIVEKAAYDCSETTQQERKRFIAKAINAALSNADVLRSYIDQLAADTDTLRQDNERLKQQYEMTTIDCRNTREREAKLAAAQKPLVDASEGLLEALATKDSWGKEVDSLYAALAKVKEGNDFERR